MQEAVVVCGKGDDDRGVCRMDGGVWAPRKRRSKGEAEIGPPDLQKSRWGR